MTNKSLFLLTEEARALDDLLDQLGGEIPDDEVGAHLSAYLEEHTLDLRAKVDGYVSLIAECEFRAEAREAEEKRFKALKEADRRKAALLRDRLKEFLARTNRPKFETDRHVVSVRRTGGKLPLVVDLAPEELPDGFRQTVTTVKQDSDAIRAALARGEELPFARLGEQGNYLFIK